jgi:hypothetical protein
LARAIVDEEEIRFQQPVGLVVVVVMDQGHSRETKAAHESLPDWRPPTPKFSDKLRPGQDFGGRREPRSERIYRDVAKIEMF